MQEARHLLEPEVDGSPRSDSAALAALYADLHRLAHRQMRQSGAMTLLDTTALVHEAWLRIADTPDQAFPDRARFLAYAARAMRSVVIDLVRARQAERRGGGQHLLTLNTAIAEQTPQHDEDVLRVHEALDQLGQIEPRLAQVVEMRYFAGLSESDIAGALGVTERTVQRDWHKARLWLAASLSG